MPFHTFTSGQPGWEKVSARELFANPHLEVHEVITTTPTRPKPVHWTVCHRKGAVVVAPRTPEGSYILVRQERVPIQRTIWEFPAGQIDSATTHDEAAIRETGLRELREESGYELGPASEVIPLGYFFPSPGFTDEHSHLLLVTGVQLSAEGTKYDENEAISEARAFTPEELKAAISSGVINDANTLATVARLLTRGIL